MKNFSEDASKEMNLTFIETTLYVYRELFEKDERVSTLLLQMDNAMGKKSGFNSVYKMEATVRKFLSFKEKSRDRLYWLVSFMNFELTFRSTPASELSWL